MDRRNVIRTTAAPLVVLALLASMAVAVLTAAPAGAAPVGTITEMARGVAQPRHAVTGPDGNLWFVTAPAAIRRMDTTGNVTGTFPLPDGIITCTCEMASGPDGNVWFTVDSNGGARPPAIGRITPAGVITIFTLFHAFGAGDPRALVAGPDGNLWFLTPILSPGGTFGLWKITTGGTATAYIDPEIGQPTALAFGPDANAWITRADNTIVRRTPGGTYTAFSNPAFDHPGPITTGSDGNLWFGAGPHGIGRITTTGTATVFTDASIDRPTSLAVGSDGALWFTNTAPNTGIGRITTAGAVTSASFAGLAWPTSIVQGPDTELWVTDTQRGSIDRLTPPSTVTPHVGNGIIHPTAMTTGPDGNVWFVNGASSIGRSTTAGDVTVFSDAAISDPAMITAGPDGNVWFTNRTTDSIGRITPAGVVTTFTDPTVVAPYGIVTGPDGNLWFTNDAAPGQTYGSIGRITPAGAITNFTGGFVLNPRQIVAGPDGALWFTNSGQGAYGYGSIGRVTTTGAISWFNPTTAHEINHPFALAVGGDGNLWFLNAGNLWDPPSAGVLSVGGALVKWFAGIDGNSIVQGSDGNIWVAGQNGTAWRVAPDPYWLRTVTGLGSACCLGLTAAADGNLWYAEQNGLGRITLIGEPDAPVQVQATALDGSAQVTWLPPPSTGGSPVTGYTVTAAPGGATCPWTGGPLTCTVPGLTNGVGYTFTVTATNASGTGPASAPSQPAVTPTAGPKFHGLAPTRILDTRPGPGQVGPAGAFGPGESRTLAVTGAAVPTGATAVLVNVTGILPSHATFLSLTPVPAAPGTSPSTSTLNLPAGAVRPNLALVPLDPSGSMAIYNNSGTVDVAIDLIGWFDDGTIDGERLHPAAPARILDTRPGPGQVGLAGPFGPGAARVLQVAGTAGVPADATAVVMNVTSVSPSQESFLSVVPGVLPPATVPGTSNLNLAAGQVRPNLVTVPLADGGKVTIYNNSGTVDVLADVVGWFEAGGGSPVQPVTPARIVDTRPGPDHVGGPGGAVAQGEWRTVATGTPAHTRAVWVNVTAVLPSAETFLAAVPGVVPPGTIPTTSNLNATPGAVVPNLVLVPVDAAGRFSVYNNSGAVDVVIDVVGYVPGSPTTG